MLEFSSRLKSIPPYPFVALENAKRELEAKGHKVIDLSIGDPDLPTPVEVIAELEAAARDYETHRYPSTKGDSKFLQAVLEYYEARFGRRYSMENVTSLIGSKEGIGHFPLAFLEPGDIVLVPKPSYPVYTRGTIFAGGQVFYIDLLPENDFFPDFSSIPGDVLKRAKILWLNYPNNPTSAVADSSKLKEAVEFCRKNGIILAFDAAYVEVYYEEDNPPVVPLMFDADDVAIEFHSLSKSYNMTGWRIGFAIGNEKLIEGLTKIKSNYDSGIFRAVQWAGAVALSLPREWIIARNRIYKRRRDMLVESLSKNGFEFTLPQATFYIWVKEPEENFVRRLLEEKYILATPGGAFGMDGYFRFSLTASDEEIEEAASRLAEL